MRLQLAFGKSAQRWLSHQAAYDLWQLKDFAKSLGVQHYRAA